MSKIVSHSLAYIFSRGVPGIINVIALAIYSRLLTPEEYGYYAIVFSIVIFIYSVLFQWLGMSLSRFFPIFNNKQEFLKSILFIFIFISAFTGFISIICMLILQNFQKNMSLGICTVLLWGYSWFELTLELIRCHLTPLRYGTVFISKAILALLFSFVLISFGYGAWSIILGNIGAIFIISLGFFKFVWKKSWQQQKNLQIINEVIQYGVPLIPTTSLTVIVMSADRLLLGWLLGDREAGLYATSYDLTASTICLSLMAIYLASYPFITRTLEQNGLFQARQQLIHYFHLLLAISLPASIGFAVLSPNISYVMLGKEFWIESTKLIPWISIISLIGGLKMFYFDLSFQLGKNTTPLIWVSFIVAVISVGLNYFFIPYYGLISVAYVGLIATTLGCVLSWWIGRKIFLIPSVSFDLVKIILACFGMLGALWPIRHLLGKEYLFLQIIVGILCYGTLGVIFNIANIRKKIFHFKTK